MRRAIFNDVLRFVLVATVATVLLFLLDEIGRRQLVKFYFYRFPAWTWTLNLGLKSAAIFMLGIALYRNFRKRERSITLKLGMSLVMLGLVFRSVIISTSLYTPVNAENVASGLGLLMWAYAMSRERGARGRKPDADTPSGHLTQFMAPRKTKH